ncbi:MAG: hypothetical protein FK733_13360 [Asgard group archaeon]|nr:hypothetical protein [Asgard group archaeon]
MENKKYIGKIVADKESNKLGKIVDIKDIQDNKTKIWKPHMLIRVKRFLRKDIIILVELSKIIKFDDFHVWLDITKDEFDLEVIETRALMYLMQD